TLTSRRSSKTSSSALCFSQIVPAFRSPPPRSSTLLRPTSIFPQWRTFSNAPLYPHQRCSALRQRHHRTIALDVQFAHTLRALLDAPQTSVRPYDERRLRCVGHCRILRRAQRRHHSRTRRLLPPMAD